MYESDEVDVFHETVKAVLFTLDVATLVMSGISVGAAVVNASARPVPVVDVAVSVAPTTSVACTQK